MMGGVTKESSKGSIRMFGSHPLDFQKTARKKFSDFSITPSGSQSRGSTHRSHIGSAVSSLGQTRYIEDWINEKSLRRIQERHSIENLESKQLYMTVLRNEENFVHGIDEFLRETDLLNLRRKELLYKDWHENVYEPTRRRIQDKIEEGYPLLDERKRAEYLKYLEYKNKKGDVFLDIMSRDEYDPMCLLSRDSPTNLKVQTPRLLDPLLVQERQRIEEERTISRCETGEILSDDAIRQKWLPPQPLRPLGRHGTTCNTWLEMPLRSIESSVHDRSRRRMKGKSNLSSNVFNNLEQSSCRPSNPIPPIETPARDADEYLEDKKQVDFSLPTSEEDLELTKEDEPAREHIEAQQEVAQEAELEG